MQATELQITKSFEMSFGLIDAENTRVKICLHRMSETWHSDPFSNNNNNKLKFIMVSI